MFLLLLAVLVMFDPPSPMMKECHPSMEYYSSFRVLLTCQQINVRAVDRRVRVQAQ
jgi:hypothetical protein